MAGDNIVKDYNDAQRSGSSVKLDDLLVRKEAMEEVLGLLEDQIYSFEGELLSNSFYGSILNGWNRAAFSIVPSRASPSALKRCFHEDERIFSRSSVEFTKRRRREAVDQENRSHTYHGRTQKQCSSVNNDMYRDNNRQTTVIMKTEPRSPSPQGKKSKLK